MKLNRRDATEPFDIDAAAERRVRELALRILRGEGRLEYGKRRGRVVARLIQDRKQGDPRVLAIVSRAMADDALRMLRDFEGEDVHAPTVAVDLDRAFRLAGRPRTAA